ncbi:MAG: hypothetical protein WBC02_00330, partial [Candidatus Aminicenantaceae bacterium]
MKQKREFYGENRISILEERKQRRKTDPSIKSREAEYRRNLKNKAYSKLGGKCVHCEESDFDILVIDHVDNDGQTERVNGISLTKIRNLILQGKHNGRYQLLCFNCNLKKSVRKVFPPLGSIKRCPTCDFDFDCSNFKKDKKYSDGLYYECRSCSSNREKTVKKIALLKLGSLVCKKCGENDIDVLTVDHISENGNERRRKDGLGVSIYRKILNGLSLDLQVLCLNCNVKKHILRNENFGHLMSGPRVENEVLEIKSKPLEAKQKIFSFNSISIVNNLDTVQFLESYHYAGFGRASKRIYSAVLNNEVVAVSKFCSPVRVGVATSLGYEFKDVLELDRFCIHPEYQKKNFASWFISRCAKSIFEKFDNLKYLVSFA